MLALMEEMPGETEFESKIKKFMSFNFSSSF